MEEARIQPWSSGAVSKGFYNKRSSLELLAGSYLALNGLFVAQHGWSWTALREPVSLISLYFGTAALFTTLSGLLSANRDIEESVRSLATINHCFGSILSFNGKLISNISAEEARLVHSLRWQRRRDNSAILHWFGTEILGVVDRQLFDEWAKQTDCNATVSGQAAQQLLAAEGWEIPLPDQPVRALDLIVALEIVAAAKYPEELEGALEKLSPSEIGERTEGSFFPRLSQGEKEEVIERAVNLLKVHTPMSSQRLVRAEAFWSARFAALELKEREKLVHSHHEWLAKRPLYLSYISSPLSELSLEEAVTLLSEEGKCWQLKSTSASQSRFSIETVAVACELAVAPHSWEARLNEGAKPLIPNAIELLSFTTLWAYIPTPLREMQRSHSSS